MNKAPDKKAQKRGTTATKEGPFQGQSSCWVSGAFPLWNSPFPTSYSPLEAGQG